VEQTSRAGAFTANDSCTFINNVPLLASIVIQDRPGEISDYPPILIAHKGNDI
jgi:hypothetical protein